MTRRDIRRGSARARAVSKNIIIFRSALTNPGQARGQKPSAEKDDSVSAPSSLDTRDTLPRTIPDFSGVHVYDDRASSCPSLPADCVRRLVCILAFYHRHGYRMQRSSAWTSSPCYRRCAACVGRQTRVEWKFDNNYCSQHRRNRCLSLRASRADESLVGAQAARASGAHKFPYTALRRSLRLAKVGAAPREPDECAHSSTRRSLRCAPDNSIKNSLNVAVKTNLAIQRDRPLA